MQRLNDYGHGDSTDRSVGFRGASDNLNRKGATQEVQIVEGCVNDNGTALTADGQTWTVTDPWVLTGHEDQEVRAKVSENGETKKIEVLRVLSGVPQYWAHWDYSEDSGYRK